MNFRSISIYLFLIIIFLFSFLPVIWLFLASVDSAATQTTKVPEYLTLINFNKAFSGRSLNWITNSIIIAVITSTLVLVICTLAAYSFSRLNFFGKNFILFGVLLLRIIPISVFILPVYIFFSKVGLVNTLTSVIISLTVLGLPFPLLLMKGFYDSIPVVFEEAAWLDGCSRIKTIFKVLLPQCGPGLAVVWFMTFMSTWGEFQIPLVLLRKINMMPLSVGIFTAYGEHGVVNFGLLSSLSILYALPPIIMYVFIQKYMVKGMVGYVKG
jgi:ABC-type glycerol-3-phosphate transport system permease component